MATYYNAPKPVETLLNKEVVEWDWVPILFPTDFKRIVALLFIGTLFSLNSRDYSVKTGAQVIQLFGLGGLIRKVGTIHERRAAGKGI